MPHYPRFRAALIAPLLLLLTACASVSVDDYRDMQPPLVLEEFFQGELTAHGVIKNRGGRVIRTFNAGIKAWWEEDGVGVLDEDFLFDDGEQQRRVWRLDPQGDGSYIGTAGDVVGQGDLRVAGNSAFLDYVLRIPYGDGTVDVRVDDRMYLVAPDILVNESEMSKFGVRVGSILLVIIKQAPAVDAVTLNTSRQTTSSQITSREWSF